jgi:hypothetical protein
MRIHNPANIKALRAENQLEEDEEDEEEEFRRHLDGDVTDVLFQHQQQQQEEGHSNSGEQQLETEGFNNVASGIAASLGLEPQQQQQSQQHQPHILIPDQSGMVQYQYRCCGSGSVGSISFWASRIRILFLCQAKKV